MWKAAINSTQQYNEGNRKKRPEHEVAEPLKEGQRVLLMNHAVVWRNKINPEFSTEVWMLVEVLDGVIVEFIR